MAVGKVYVDDFTAAVDGIHGSGHVGLERPSGQKYIIIREETYEELRAAYVALPDLKRRLDQCEQKLTDELWKDNHV